MTDKPYEYVELIGDNALGHAQDFARAATPNGGLPLTVFFALPQGTNVAGIEVPKGGLTIAVDIEQLAQRLDIRAFLNESARFLDAASATILAEAWQARSDVLSHSQRQAIISGRMRVSDLPLDDRLDTVTLVHQQRDGTVEMHYAMIEQHADGPRTLGPWSALKSDAEEVVALGRFIIGTW